MPMPETDHPAEPAAAAILAEADIDMRWLVSAVEFNDRLGGWVGSLNGSAFSGGTDCVVARGTVLVKHLGVMT